jgi:hypothetical protein
MGMSKGDEKWVYNFSRKSTMELEIHFYVEEKCLV